MSDATTRRRIWWWPAAAATPMLMLLLLLIVAGSQPASCSPSALRNVCRNAQVPIGSVQEFGRLVEELESDHSFKVCPRRYREAFSQLASIMLPSDKFVCSDEKFELIKQFHFRFIPELEPEASTSDDDGDDDDDSDDEHEGEPKSAIKRTSRLKLGTGSSEDSLSPIALQQLFKAYVMQVSGLCKQFLAENVDWAMRSMSDYDEELFKLAKFMPSEPSSQSGQQPAEPRDDDDNDDKDKGNDNDDDDNQLISHVTIPERLPGNGGLPFRELVYMPELEGELEQGDIERQQEVTQVDLRDKPTLNQFMWACQKRFKPVYSKLVIPISRLAKLGYNYAGHKLDSFQAKLASDDVNTWKMITLICESRGKVQLAGEDERHLEPLRFVPPISRSIGGALWIRGAEQLAFELKNTDALRLRGFQKFLHDSHLAGRNFAAAMDPNRFAWYRENTNGIKLILNTMRIMTTFMSKSVKVFMT